MKRNTAAPLLPSPCAHLSRLVSSSAPEGRICTPAYDQTGAEGRGGKRRKGRERKVKVMAYYRSYITEDSGQTYFGGAVDPP